jgi:hypothetical protein
VERSGERMRAARGGPRRRPERAIRCGGLFALFLVTLALGGCESTAEKSAQLERVAKHAALRSERGLSIAQASPYVKVVATQVLHAGEQAAAVVTLRNTSSRPLRDAPIAITVRDARGASVFRNNAPGLEAALTTVALIPARAQTVWIDDQVQASGGAPTSVSALVGEGRQPAPASVPRLSVAGVHLIEDPASGVGATGTVANDSTVTQQNLVVYCVARRGDRIVAAGRAILPEVPPHGSAVFELFFVGSPKGAQLQTSVAPSTF